ncbi:MAG: hypothetical protein ACWGQW_09315 [bacterium]
MPYGPGYQSDYIPNFWASYRQRRATGGRPLTSGETRGLLFPLAQAEASKAIAAGDRALQQYNINKRQQLVEQQINAQNRAAKVSGLTDIAGLGLAYKLGSERNQLFKGFLGGGAANAAGTGTALGSANTIGEAFASTPSPFQGIGPLSSFQNASAPLTPAATAGAGLLGAGAGAVTSNLLGANKDISQGLTLGGAGAGIGFAVGGPVGAAIGGGIGIGASLLDDVGDFFGGLF